MTERQLESFLSAADRGSFSKAAKRNYISVQAFIQQIDLLEESLGFDLFIRSNRGIRMTASGEKFYATARKILDLYYNSLEEIKKEESMELKIAVPEEQYPDFLLRVCQKFSEIYPQIRIQFVSAPMTEHFAMIRNYEADCSFVGEPEKKYLTDLEYESLSEDVYAFGMTSNHSLAEKKMLTVEDLPGQTVYCGRYPFMRQTFVDGLSTTGARIMAMDQEYDFTTKSKVLFGKDLLVFPSQWSSFYGRTLHVVPSNLSAGSIGILYRRSAKQNIRNLIHLIKEEIKE